MLKRFRIPRVNSEAPDLEVGVQFYRGEDGGQLAIDADPFGTGFCLAEFLGRGL
jgi:hypothetical protein